MLIRAPSIALFSSLFIASTAFAQLEETGDGGGGGGGARFGVGMETLLTAPFAPNVSGAFTPGGAAAFSYDMGQFRVDGLLYLLFIDDATTTFAVGARFFYELHSTSKADFSIGGGAAFGFADSGRGGDADLRVAMEGAFQIRLWLASNAAINGSAGLGFSVGDDPFVFGIAGHLTGGFGLIYYFD